MSPQGEVTVVEVAGRRVGLTSSKPLPEAAGGLGGRFVDRPLLRQRAGELDPRLSTGRLGPTLGQVRPIVAVTQIEALGNLANDNLPDAFAPAAEPFCERLRDIARHGIPEFQSELQPATVSPCKASNAAT